MVHLHHHNIFSTYMELPVKRPPQGSSTSETRYNLQTKNLSYKLVSRPISHRDFGWLFPWKFGTGRSSGPSDHDKSILENVSCEAKPGQVTAIAGPSGAGKTTLLEILSGTISPCRVSSGGVLVNGKPMDAARFRRLSGYVTQDEALFPLLTVEETLTYSARLRANGAGSRVRKLLKALALEHIAGARVGGESSRGISGGEKRRLSIGVDLVHDPPVLLLDEPTSGLDSASALDVMLLLKSMAQDKHKTIVVTIHQPGFRILDLLDRVILLSKGTVVHDGSLQLLEEQLRLAGHSIPCHVNMLEFAMDVSSEILLLEKDDNVGNIENTCHQSIMEEARHDVALSYSNSPFKEILILSQRFSTNVFRTKQLFLARTSQALLAGIVLGTIFISSFGGHYPKRVRMQNQMGFFAFSLTFLMSSTTEALPIFLQERRILTRDTSRGAYRVSSYVVANALVFLPFLLIVALLYATPVYYLVGLRRDNKDGFLYFTLVVWTVVLASNSFVACFSALVPDYISGMSVIAGVMGSFFLFSGYFVSKDDMPWCWRFMQYLSLFRYPFECFMINEYGGEQGRSKCLESIGGDGCLVYGDQFMMKEGLKETQKWSNLVVMLGFILGYRCLAFVFLRLRCFAS